MTTVGGLGTAAALAVGSRSYTEPADEVTDTGMLPEVEHVDSDAQDTGDRGTSPWRQISQEVTSWSLFGGEGASSMLMASCEGSEVVRHIHRLPASAASDPVTTWGANTSALITSVRAQSGRVIAFYNRTYVILDEPCDSTSVDDLFDGATLVADTTVAPGDLPTVFPGFEWVGHIWNAVMNDAQMEWSTKSAFSDGLTKMNDFLSDNVADVVPSPEPTSSGSSPLFVGASCQEPTGTANMGDSILNAPPVAFPLFNDQSQPVTGGWDIGAITDPEQLKLELLRLAQQELVEPAGSAAPFVQDLKHGEDLGVVLAYLDPSGYVQGADHDDLVRVGAPDPVCTVDPMFAVRSLPQPPTRYQEAAWKSDCEARKELDRGRFATAYRHRLQADTSRVHNAWSQYEGGKTVVALILFSGTNDFATAARRTRALTKAGMGPLGHLAQWDPLYVHQPSLDLHLLEVPWTPTVAEVRTAVNGTDGTLVDMDPSPGVRLSLLSAAMDWRAEDALIAEFVDDPIDFQTFKDYRCNLNPAVDQQQACTIAYLQFQLTADSVMVNLQFDGHGSVNAGIGGGNFSGESASTAWSYSINNPGFALPAWTPKLIFHETSHGYGSIDEYPGVISCDETRGYMNRTNAVQVGSPQCIHLSCVMHKHSPHWTSSMAATPYCEMSQELVGIRDEQAVSGTEPDCQYDPMDSMSDVRMRKRPHYAVLVRWLAPNNSQRSAVFLKRPFDDAIAFLNSGPLALGSVTHVEVVALWPGYAYDCAVPAQGTPASTTTYEAYTLNAISSLTVRATNPVPVDLDGQLVHNVDKPVSLPAVVGDDNYAYHKFGLVLRYGQQVSPPAGQGAQTLNWPTNLRYLDADYLEANAVLDNFNDTNTNQTSCTAMVAPTGTAAEAVLSADMEVLLVELETGYIAFHTVAGLMAWVNTTYGSYSAAPILRLGWVFHQPQLDRLGLVFGVNLTWGD